MESPVYYYSSFRNIHMHDFHDDARDHHGSQCKQ